MRSILIVIALLLIAAAVLIVRPIYVPYTLVAAGRIMPARAWILLRGERDNLISLLRDNKLGRTDSFSVSYFERGDDLAYEMDSRVKVGMRVAVGDTIARLNSLDIIRDLARLKAELANAEATLRSLQAGAKEAEIEEVRRRLVYAKTQLEQQTRRTDRIRALFKKHLVSEEDLELEQNTLRLQRLQIDIVKAQLQVLQTGSTPAELDLVRSHIAGIRSEIAINERRLENFTLTAPIDGHVTSYFSGDSLVVVHDVSEYVVVMPVLWKEKDYIALHQEISMAVPGESRPLSAKIHTLGSTVQNMNGDQIVALGAIVDVEGVVLAPGLTVRCSIPCEPVTILEYLRRKFLH